MDVFCGFLTDMEFELLLASVLLVMSVLQMFFVYE